MLLIRWYKRWPVALKIYKRSFLSPFSSVVVRSFYPTPFWFNKLDTLLNKKTKKKGKEETSAPIIASLSASMVGLLYSFTVTLSKFNVNEVCTQQQLDSKWAPGLFLTALTSDTVPAIPCLLVKRLQPLHQRLCNIKTPPGQSWQSSGSLAFKISALA